MGFLSPLLLAGAALAAVPVVLHLVMRRQARPLVFPALRFVQQRRDSNRRRMRLRHWLLLALRCALVALVAFALARPTLKGSGLRGKEGAPLAVAVVMDNSLRMDYVHQNRSRLEQAAGTAQELVGKLPEDSSVAVCDLGRAAAGFAPDLSAAVSRLRTLRTAADARPLAAVVVEAVALVAEQAERRQEVFVFTDMTSSAWNEEGRQAVDAALGAAPGVRIYIFDVGVATPKNAALGELVVRRSVLRPGEPLEVQAPVSSNLGGEPPLVELRITGADGRPATRGQQIVELDASGQARVAFGDVADLPLGTHQGSVQLATADPLSVDNTRYFTVEVRPPAKVLLLAERPGDARLVQLALAPPVAGVPTRFEAAVAPFATAAVPSQDNFHAVLMLDPPALSEEIWTRLAEYASAGGGVGLFLGHNAEFQALNAEAPQRLLPGRLLRISRDATYIRPQRLDHPALAGLRNYEAEFPWPLCKVFRYWQLGKPASGTYVAATFANEDPAVIERVVGRGRVLTVTTPFSDPLAPEGRQPWNVMLSAEVAFPFLALCDQLTGYLAQDADERLDYLAGETARVRLGPQQQVTNYVLRTPDGQSSGRVGAGDGELAVGATDELGNYRLTAGGEAKTLDRGFSVNARPEVSDLTRLDPELLLDALPKDRVRLASNLDEVEAYVNVGRSGRELYPWAIAMVALVWGAEHVLANRFYGKTV
ncbi:MAG TPA: BatA and WFA domain-containing protein [Lacipirellulaceae bacterium]|nr:BatA and WFA domain-containing protein [Lacipirellulaceae bacterium]